MEGRHCLVPCAFCAPSLMVAGRLAIAQGIKNLVSNSQYGELTRLDVPTPLTIDLRFAIYFWIDQTVGSIRIDIDFLLPLDVTAPMAAAEIIAFRLPEKLLRLRVPPAPGPGAVGIEFSQVHQIPVHCSCRADLNGQ